MRLFPDLCLLVPLANRFMSNRLEIQTACFCSMHIVCTTTHLRNNCSDDLDEMKTVVIQGVGGSILLLEQNGALLFVRIKAYMACVVT